MQGLIVPRLSRGEHRLFDYNNLHWIEHELDQDGQRFNLVALNKEIFRVNNPLFALQAVTCCFGDTRVPDSQGVERERWNIVKFTDERTLEAAFSSTTRDAFLPLSVEVVFKVPPMITEEVAKLEMLISTLAWQVEPRYEFLIQALERSRLHEVDKIVAFGLGSLTGRPSRTTNQREHALAMTVARVIRRMYPGKEVPVWVQDPDYNEVDKVVLNFFGFRVVEGHGALGFTKIDTHTFVLNHNASFPMREIVADLDRPAAVFWKPEIPQDQHDANPQLARTMRDVDSVRTRRMMQEYDHEPIPGSSLNFHQYYDYSQRLRGQWRGGEIFGNSALYIRKPPSNRPRQKVPTKLPSGNLPPRRSERIRARSSKT
ncbi:hypothetical protein F5Y02DRAFT_416934 [Annulohypoxylon stygium]|nr:hypothetical protein F5Y02DRAFT_416934 [Annulohypoxylon stygium]